MKTPETWPQRVQRGNAVVKIYRYDNKGYPEFKLAYYDPTGKRRLQTFADYADAIKQANNVTAAVNKGEAETLTLTSKDRLTYMRAVDVLKPTGFALDIAAHQFVEAHKRLAGRSISEAVEFYLKRNPVKHPAKTVAEAVTEFIEFTR